MVLALSVAVVLAVPPKVAVPGMTGVGLERAQTEFFTEHFAGALRQAGLLVVTQSEIGALLGLERQKQLLGCGDATSSCMAELANALGADVVALGGIAKLGGGSYQVTLKLLQATDGRVLAQQSGRAASDEKLTDALTRAAHELGREVLTVLRPQEPVPPSPDFSRRPLRGVSWLPALLGLTSAGVGVALAVLASSAHTRLTAVGQPALSEAQAQALADGGKTSQLLAGVLLGVGGAALGLAATFFLFAEDGARLEASLTVTATGVALTGVWP